MSKVKVYRFSLLPPHENHDLVREQMRLVHRYRNILVEIERGRRTAVREVLSSYEHIKILEKNYSLSEEICILRHKEIKAARAVSRKRSETESMRAALIQSKTEKSEARKKLIDARRALKEDVEVQGKLSLLDERANDLRKNARAHSGVYWGTYLIAENANDASRNAAAKAGPDPEHDPRFVRWDGHGQVGIQIQNGLNIANAFGNHSQLRIEPGVPRKENQKLKEAHRVLTMRVSSKGRDPIWAKWRIYMHNPIPENAIIKNVTVHVVERGPSEEWYVTITVDLSACNSVPVHGEGVSGLDVGWRLLPETRDLRVAVISFPDGTTKELRLPIELINRFRKIEDLRSIRDKGFDLARPWTVEILDSVKDKPEWLIRETKSLSQWKSTVRLVRLMEKWRVQRFKGDELGYNAVESWRHWDKHLWTWEAHQRISTIRKRRDIYRCFAKNISRTSEVIAIEDFDLRTMAEHAPIEEKDNENASARSARFIASVRELRNCILNAVGTAGGRIVKVDPAFTTHICHVCDQNNLFDAAEYLKHTCVKCKTTWDQDENAAHVIRKRGILKWDEVKQAEADRALKNANAPAEVTPVSRWAKLKKVAAEKRAAREATKNSAE